MATTGKMEPKLKTERLSKEELVYELATFGVTTVTTVVDMRKTSKRSAEDS